MHLSVRNRIDMGERMKPMEENPLGEALQDIRGVSEVRTEEYSNGRLLVGSRKQNYSGSKCPTRPSAAGRGQDHTRKNSACRAQRCAGCGFTKPAPLATVIAT